MLSSINSMILGPFLTIVLLSSCVFFLVKLRLKPFIKPAKMLGAIFGNGHTSSFKSACLALSGTLGVGNIAGVAAAIGTGGAGSIFWMWIFALAAMIIKYAEVVIAMRYNHLGEGGAALYMRYGLNKPRLALIFSILILITSIGVGNTVQSSAAAESMRICFGIPSIFTGIVFSVITLIMIYGGRRRIERVSSIVIPILSIGYVLVSLCVIISKSSMIPSVMNQIISEAFDFKAFSGGALGFVFSRAVRLGASRGILSNEAGCGTASYAHKTNCHPAEQGVWGIFEVFIDTILLCTLTAFVVLLSPNVNLDGNGIKNAIEAYGYYGDWIGQFIGISSFIYALASVVCWSYYGVSALAYLGGKKNSRILYLLVYSFAGIIGSVFSPYLVWEISDLTISLMAIVNTACVIALYKEIKTSTDDYFV